MDRGERTGNARFAWSGPARSVALAGEIGDWQNHRPFRRREDGSFAIDVPVTPGVHAYKFVIDGEWVLDRSNPRTRNRSGDVENVLVVEGTAEPLLHAAAPPFLVEDDRGGVLLRVALRREAVPSPSSFVVVWREGTDLGGTRTPLLRVDVEGEHDLYEVHLPTSAARLRYHFELDGRSFGRATDAEGAPTVAPSKETVPFTFDPKGVRERAPDFWGDAVVYTVFVDRFRPETDLESWGREAWSADESKRTFAGGHLEGLRRSLDVLADLGVNVLHLTPVHEGASNHRYDFVDPTKVDPALGGDAAFARLVEDAHAREMRIVLDFSFVHAGAGFPRAEDVMLHGRSSEWASWFLWDDEGALRHYGKRKDAPLVDLTHPEVADWVVSLAEAWARRGVDGFRLDMAAEVPLELAERVRTTLRRWRPESVVLGEVVPAHAHRWTTAGAVDAATDFGFHGAVTAWLAEGRTDAAAFVRTWRSSARLRGTPESAAVRFLSTHDHVRFESLAMRNGRSNRVPVGLVLLATVPGVPMLLYGEETGMGHDARELAPENVWADRAPRPWSDAVHARHALLRSLFRLRKEHRALRGGSFEFVHDGDDVLVYRRSAGRDVVDVVLHAGAGTRTLSLEDETFPNARVAVVSGDATFEGGSATLRGPGALVLVRDDTREQGTTRVHLVRANEVRKDRAFVHGDVRPAALPVRLDFAVTERCNLRCVHCITDAPERTANGSARTLSRAVLDALAPDLAFARYFGFVHGGESLTAPVFFDVLRTIREARGAEPTVVHLLSNGVLLHERNLHRLFDTGVNSISVSLDGGTAATNDVLRVGGKLEAILANVAAAVRIRAERNIDVRLGISTVVMPANVDELRELVDRAVDVGVDWVKLEELVPVNAFSRKALPDYDAANVRSAILRAAEHGRARGIRVVEHVGAPDVWRCRLDARTEAFLADDEFANRSSIHPCRARWDIACIEPDGDVRIGDFFGRVLGNVLHAPLDELWRSSVASDERRASQVGRLCGPTGPVTCVDGG